MSDTFEIWYAEMVREVIGLCGLSVADLPDDPSFDCWEAGDSAREYARGVIAKMIGYYA